MRAVIYARVSTNAGEYVDLGISGTKEKRLELDRLVAGAHRRQFDALIVWKFDRCARSVSQLLKLWRHSGSTSGSDRNFLTGVGHRFVGGGRQTP